MYITFKYIIYINVYMHTLQHKYESWTLSPPSYSCYFSPTCTSPIVPRLPSFIFAKYLIGKMANKNAYSSEMVFVKLHECTHQVTDWTIRDQEFHTDLEYKQRCLDNEDCNNKSPVQDF